MSTLAIVFSCMLAAAHQFSDCLVGEFTSKHILHALLNLTQPVPASLRRSAPFNRYVPPLIYPTLIMLKPAFMAAGPAQRPKLKLVVMELYGLWGDLVHPLAEAGLLPSAWPTQAGGNQDHPFARA